MTLTYAQSIMALSDAALVTERANNVAAIGIDPQASNKVQDCDAETLRRATYDDYDNEPPQGGAEID